MLTPYQIAQEKMLGRDHFSQWLGIEISEIKKGQCCLRMKVRSEMLNGFHISHGGITYSLADSALAFASNSYGYHAVSIETSISHIKPVSADDLLTAFAKERSRSKTLGVYDVEITNQDDKTVALFKGTVFIKKTIWK
jgi:acyl-CoA thioesterase